MNDAKNYRKAYETGESIEFFRKFREIVGKNLHDVSRDIIENVHLEPPSILNTPCLDILDIGCGNGKSTAQIAAHLSMHRKKFALYPMDVSESQINDYVNLFCYLRWQSDGNLTSVVNPDWRVCSWEDYKPEHKFDVVLALHSWYGIDNWQEDNENNTLRKVVDVLNPGGRAYITVQQKGSMWDEVGKSQGLVRVTGDDICSALHNLGINHEKRDILDDVVNMSVLYNIYGDVDGDGLTEDGKAVVSFILRKDYNSLPEKTQDQIEDFMSDIADNHDFAMDDLIIIKGDKK